MHRSRRAFTLMELLVVVGIIIVLTALSIPAITKFLEGQSLTQSGRIVQSAFNEARRAAITQRAKNYLVFFRQEDDSRPGEYLYGIRRFRVRVGYEGEAHFLLPGVKFDMVTDTSGGPLPAGAVGKLRGGLPLPVFNGLPDEDDANYFPGRATVSQTYSWVEFLRDGTIQFPGIAADKPAKIIDGESLFDLNAKFDLSTAAFDPLADDVDLNLREVTGGDDVDKRCFIDVDKNTGRVRFRVLQVTAGYESGT